MVIRSDNGKGGTWSGATECLKKCWSPVFCRENPNSEGNRKLIQQGAKAIDDSWTPTSIEPVPNFIIEDEEPTYESPEKDYFQIQIPEFSTNQSDPLLDAK